MVIIIQADVHSYDLASESFISCIWLVLESEFSKKLRLKLKEDEKIEFKGRDFLSVALPVLLLLLLFFLFLLINFPPSTTNSIYLPVVVYLLENLKFLKLGQCKFMSRILFLQ